MSKEVDSAVRERYSAAAEVREAALCCPVDYDPQYLKVIPEVVIERDYGCGDPSKYVLPGETVLDLGSGTGKICFIASQVVGAEGRVIGVDVNDEMLDIANDAKSVVAEAIGYDNVEFRKGKIQDLKLDRDNVNAWLKANPIADESGFKALEDFMEADRVENPLVADGSIDVVVSNCVLNLVASDQKKQLFEEIFRVLKRGGRAVISDIVGDEDVPLEMQDDAELWSGCISGAFEESAFVQAFVDAGFYGVEIIKRDESPWQIVKGFEFRSVTVVAYKGKEGVCLDHNEAVIYKGPFSAVKDDDGHTYPRGERVAVCRKTFEILSKAPYSEHFYAVDPIEAVAEGDAPLFPCDDAIHLRHPRQTKGEGYALTNYCGPSTGCC